MKNIILATLCSVLLAGCGSSDENSDISEGETKTPEVSTENNNWDEGNWNEITWN